MYIGADTACSIKAEDGYRRFSDDMPKLFSLGQSVFFCSGRKSDAEKCVSWIYDHFKNNIDIEKLGNYLKNNYITLNKDNVFNVEFLLCDYNNHKVIQLSQYNDFKPMIYNCSDELRILCGGYKTKDSFLIAKKNLILNKSVRETYKDVFESISDECVGGKVILYNSSTSFEVILLEETNIKYVNNDKELFLLTSDFVTSGVVNGSQIIGGDIYSQNYVPGQKGTYLDLINGDYQLAGGKFLYNSSTDTLKITGVDIEWSSSTTPKITDIDGLSNTLSTQSASITANSNAITAEVKRATEVEGNLSASIKVNADAITSEVTRAKGAESSLSSSITQTANSIKSEVSATYETKTNAQSNYTALQSSITQNANNIALKVSKTDYNGKEVVSLINQTAEAVSINANKINLNGAVTANNYFKINTDGSMETTSGKIGGWTINSTAIYTGTGVTSNSNGAVAMSSADFTRTINGTSRSGLRFAIGGNFGVTNTGKIYANGAEISGKLTAGSGSVIGSGDAGWIITNSQIKTVLPKGGTPYMTISTGANGAADTYILAPDCFQIGGVDPNGTPIGAVFTKKVTIGSGGCDITGNCNITGSCTASSIVITGKQIGTTGTYTSQLGGFYITNDGDFQSSKTAGDSSVYYLRIYPNGSNHDGTGNFIALYHAQTGQIVRRLSSNGWS